MSNTPETRARKLTNAVIDAVESKVRAGDWVSVEAIRHELHMIITSYEKQIDAYKEFVGSIGGEEE